MTWHNLSWILAQCKSKTNLLWQVQLSWRDPTGISNTLTSQIKPSAWRMCPPWVREKIIKNTDGLSACRKADVDCILMADIFREVLRLTFSPIPRGERVKKHIQKRTMRSKRNACLKIWRGQTVTVHPTKELPLRDDDYIELSCYLFIVKLRQPTFSFTPYPRHQNHSSYWSVTHLNGLNFEFFAELHWQLFFFTRASTWNWTTKLKLIQFSMASCNATGQILLIYLFFF